MNEARPYGAREVCFRICGLLASELSLKSAREQIVPLAHMTHFSKKNLPPLQAVEKTEHSHVVWRRALAQRRS